MSNNAATIYTITSNKFNGSITVAFTQEGECVLYDAQVAKLTATQQDWIMKRLTLKQTGFLQALEREGAFNIVGSAYEVTFEMFWNKYDEKDRSSKKKAETKWQRMSREQKILAYAHIPTYFKNIPGGVAKKYAETYLNSELWNN
jgi:hypothetical protein